jgi:hypothetical protein
MRTLVCSGGDDKAPVRMQASLAEESNGGFGHRVGSLAEGQNPDPPLQGGWQLFQPGSERRARISGLGGCPVELGQEAGSSRRVAQTSLL